jgi:Zn-dependent peptidase ImmA (M78 family)
VRNYVNIDAEIERLVRFAHIPRLTNGIGIDVESLMREAFDFDVAYIERLELRGRSILGLLIPEHRLVLVEANDMRERQRFTLAHECGHLILDFKSIGNLTLFGDDSLNRLFSCSATDIDLGSDAAPWKKRRETLSNKFAASLLMPAKLCIELYRQSRGIEDCAQQLGVSNRACAIRLAELGLISQS